MIIHDSTLAPQTRVNQAIAAFLMPHYAHEDSTMQTYHTQRATPAQNILRPDQRSGITFVILFSLALFLAYAVQNHWVTDAFVALCSLFFDSFSVKSSSALVDIILLIAFCLMLFGLFCVFKFFMPIALTVLVIAVVAWLFLATNADKPHEVKLKSGEKFERVYGG